jgi:O-antigen ligase
MQWQINKNRRISDIGLSIVVLILALLSGFMVSKNLFMIIALCVLFAATVLLFTGLISIWMLSLIFIGVGISLGRFYIVFGPNPLNSARIQQAGLIALAFLAIYFNLSHLRSGTMRSLAIPKFTAFGIIAYLLIHVVGAMIHWGDVPDWGNFRPQIEVIFFAPFTFLIAFLLFKKDEHAIQFLWTCLIIGAFQAGLAFVQILFPGNFFVLTQKISPTEALSLNYFLTYNRVNGIWEHAPALGALMAMIIPTGVYLVGNSQGFKKGLAVVGLSAILITLLATAAIMPITVGLFFGFLLVILKSRVSIFQKIASLLGILLVLVTAVFALSFIFDVSLKEMPFIDRLFRSNQGVFGANGSLYSRMIMYREAIRLWQNNPLWGVGVGQFRTIQRSIYDLTAHSVYLQALAETGTIGTTGLLILIISLSQMNIQAWHKMNASERNLYIPIILLSFILLTVSIVDYSFNVWNFQLLFWFSQGIIARKYKSLQTIQNN